MTFLPAPDGSLILYMFRTAEMELFNDDSTQIFWLNVTEGQTVAAEHCLLQLAGSKLEVEVFAPGPCRVEKVLVSTGQSVTVGDPLLILHPL